MTKTNIQITRYRHGDFFVDIVANKEQHMNEAWLFHKDYGIADYILGVDVKVQNFDQFFRTLEAILPASIRLYKEDHFEEVISDET